MRITAPALALLGLLLAEGVAAQPAAIGYVFADKPTQASYQPDETYAYNSGRGSVKIGRSSVGRYGVTFENLRIAGGNVQVSAHGNVARHCAAASWSTGGSAFGVNVACFDAGGNPADSAFSLLATSRSGFRNPFAFAWASKSGTARATLTDSYVHNGSGQAVESVRSGEGVYRVSFAGLSMPSGNVQVTGYGSSATCQPVTWSRAGQVTVQCFDSDGNATDSRFSILALGPEAVYGEWSYALVTSAQAGDKPVPSPWTRAQSGVNRVARIDTGTYRVKLGGLENRGGVTLVSPYGLKRRRCTVADGKPEGDDQVVDVRCFDPSGSPADGAFSLLHLNLDPSPPLLTFQPPTISTPLLVIVSDRPSGPAEDLGIFEDLGAFPGWGAFPSWTIANRHFKARDSSKYYYVPESFRLVPGTGSGHGLSAVWTNDETIRMTMVLGAPVASDELETATRLVRDRYGERAELLPFPYQAAEIEGLDGMSDWSIEEIRVPELGAVDLQIPLTMSMSPESFDNVKAALEGEGLGGSFVMKSGENERAVNIRMSLRHPSGVPHSTASEIDVGLDREQGRLVFGRVKNHLPFPMTVTGVDVVFDLGDAGAETLTNLGVSQLVIGPGEAVEVAAAISGEERFARELGVHAPAAEPRERDDRRNPLRDLVDRVLSTDEEEVAPEGQVIWDPKLAGALDRFALRYSVDHGCQECFDAVWSTVEAVSYVERRSALRLEAVEAIFSETFPGAGRIERIELDLRSPYFSAEGSDLARSVVLSPENRVSELRVYQPLEAGSKFGFKYRLRLLAEEGEFSGDWTAAVDRLSLTIGRAAVAALVSAVAN